MDSLVKTGLTGAAIIGASYSGLACAKVLAKKNGKPFGRPGSDLHALTNDKLDLKAYTKERTVADAKRGIKLGCVTGGIAAIAGLTTKASKGLGDTLSSCKSLAGDACEQVKFGEKNLKQMITDSKAYQAVDKLPRPVKAAACVATAVLVAALPSVAAARNASNAYLEAKYEKKD